MEVNVLDFDGYVEECCREVTGAVSIDGVWFAFELSTDDGFTSIYIKNAEGKEASAWDPEDLLEELGLDGFEEYELYDLILDAVGEKYPLEDC